MPDRRRGLSPREKVRTAAAFARIKAEGKTLKGRCLILRYLENGLAEARLGLIVSRKHGGAVLRNRLKRRLREIFRLNKAAFPRGWDIVVIPYGAAGRSSLIALQSELLSLLGKLTARI